MTEEGTLIKMIIPCFLLIRLLVDEDCYICYLQDVVVENKISLLPIQDER